MALSCASTQCNAGTYLHLGSMISYFINNVCQVRCNVSRVDFHPPTLSEHCLESLCSPGMSTDKGNGWGGP